MGFKCGIVGLPNVGKSSLFNALTSSRIAAENYPFCTIEPNVGIVPVPDPRLDRIAEIVGPKDVVPSTVEFVDIAGLVAGASKGEGLGNQFLSHIRETQAIAHVLRCFEDDNVVHVAGKIDPVADAEVVETELLLADLESVGRALERAQKQGKSGDKDALVRSECFAWLEEKLDTGSTARSLALAESWQPLVRQLNLLTAKQVLFVANIGESDLAGNALTAAVDEMATAVGAESVVICAALEAEIAALDAADRAEFLADVGIAEPGLDRFIRAGYHLLGLHSYFTTGAKECRAWTVPKGAHARRAAGVAHTDFERGFIRAEVIDCDDFIDCNGETGARDAGRMRVEGKDYLVRDGDVIRFRFNV